MKIPPDIIEKYGVSDHDVSLFVTHFDEPEGSRILIAGCHDEPTANMLADCGFFVVGVDLREYQASDPGKPTPKCNYYYLRADFCDLNWEIEAFGRFDVFVSLSAIEHFGLGGYSEGNYHPYYDVLAMRKAWEFLREGGKAYITVPVGGQFMEVRPHWRVYDLRSIQERLVQDFQLHSITSCVAGPIVLIDGRVIPPGTLVGNDFVQNFLGSPPHVSALVVMEKVASKRLAPDGR